MRDSPLLFGLAAVFAGLTTVLAVVAFVTHELFVLGVAMPLGLATYLFWFQASGKLRERVEAGTYRDAFRSQRRAADGEGPNGPQSRFAREARQAAEERRRRARAAAGAGRSATGGRTAGSRRGRRTARPRDGPTRREALNRLGLDEGSDQATIREAYREKVKEVHPDTADGDEEAFKRVTAAYDRLSED
ncbi:J domain-containing protein [Haloarchaeobius sp. HRN-SO-5]|uniref:J domain-containing protein n=1 Tax=Haloarchaeobius sp. HRN-SO-5 TaxID=3446118 RepID=UPI003EB6BDCB